MKAKMTDGTGRMFTVSQPGCTAYSPEFGFCSLPPDHVGLHMTARSQTLTVNDFFTDRHVEEADQ